MQNSGLIYITHGMKLYTLLFLMMVCLKTSKIGRNVLLSNIIAVIIIVK